MSLDMLTVSNADEPPSCQRGTNWCPHYRLARHTVKFAENGNHTYSPVNVAGPSKRVLLLVALIVASRYQQKKQPRTLKQMHPALRRAGVGNGTGKDSAVSQVVSVTIHPIAAFWSALNRESNGAFDDLISERRKKLRQ
jgi:hypothetical protein